jgi:hypothetical protein
LPGVLMHRGPVRVGDCASVVTRAGVYHDHLAHEGSNALKHGADTVSFVLGYGAERYHEKRSSRELGEVERQRTRATAHGLF